MQPLWAQEKIPHAIGLYFTPKGVDTLNANIEELLFQNGVGIENAFFPAIGFETEEATIEEMLGSQDDLKEIVTHIKENISRFFIGLDLDKHKFKIDLAEIEFFAKWSEIRVDFKKPVFNELARRVPRLSMDFMIEAEQVQINVTKIDIRDLNHPFLGEFGLDHAEVSIDQERSEPLFVKFPVHVYKDNGQVEIVVDAPETNLDGVILKSNFRSPLRMPVIEVRINDHVVRLNQNEVEGMFREKQGEIFRVAQSEIQNWLETEAPALINKTLVEKLEGDLIEVNQMDPPGAPAGALVPKFEWGLTLEDLDFSGELIHIGLDGFVRDPSMRNTPALGAGLVSRQLPKVQNPESLSHDLILSLNQGFINKIVQLSANRGYFKSVDLENGEKIILSKVPTVRIDSKTIPYLALEIEYTVTGLQAAFVKNPIRIAFNMNIAFEVDRNTGLTKMVSRGVDLNSVFLDSKYIRMFAGTVRSAVNDKIKEMQKDLDGFEIVDEFPIPASLFGLNLKTRKTQIDKSGHLLLYIDFLE